MPDPLEVILARVETKLDSALAQGRDHEGRLRELEAHDVSTLRETVAKLTEAVDALQRWRWILTGAAAVSGGSVGALVQHLVGK